MGLEKRFAIAHVVLTIAGLSDEGGRFLFFNAMAFRRNATPALALGVAGAETGLDAR